MPQVKSLVIGLMLMGLLQPLLAQEDIIKAYAEEHDSRSYCLYPSTLRMINLTRNEAFDEMASSFEKILIYELDSLSVINKSYRPMLTNYEKEGFEEYITMVGAGTFTVILGKEKRVNEMVGVLGIKDQMFAFFVRGNIAWQKIPTLINTLSENDLLNVLELQTEEWE